VTVVELAIPARQAYLSLVRLVVDAAVAALAPGLGSARLDDLKLAVSEACSNAIEAHESAWSAEPIVVRCQLDNDMVTVEVADRGGGFDPGGLSTLPSATDPGRLDHENGLGIPLMRTLADTLTFEPAGDGTTVRLTVYRAGSG
jgi:serine/threonine-protein kinase RsbW